MGALKDHLVDPKALPADRVGHLGGLADLLVDPEVYPAKKSSLADNQHAGCGDLLYPPYPAGETYGQKRRGRGGQS